MISHNSPALIPLISLGSAIALPLIAFKKKALAHPFTLLVSFTMVILSFYNIARVWQGERITYHFGGWLPPVGIEYLLDPLSAFIACVINTVAFFVLIHAGGILEREVPHRTVPYCALILLFLCGANGIIITGDVFNLYVFLEIFSLAGYGLIAVGERAAVVASFRYLILGTLGASFYLLGVGFLYIVTGSLNMADLKRIIAVIPVNPALIAALALMVTGMALKMALFPLHGWLPDAYTYAPSTTSALIAPIGTKVAAYVLIRLLFFVFGIKITVDTIPLLDVIGYMAAAGVLYGSLLAIAQKEMKRMLAYSSVAQIGYIGIGLSLANPMGYIGAVLHILNHAFMKGALFLVAGNLRNGSGHSEIPRFDARLRKKYPGGMAAFSVAALSMIGIPPMAGFFSKWYLSLGAVEKSNWVMLAVILISSLLNAVYFTRIWERVYLIKGNEENDDTLLQEKEPLILLVPTLILSFSLILLGLGNSFLVTKIIARIIPPGM